MTYSAAARVLARCARPSSAVGLISGDHVAGQVARVRARVGERLVLLVAGAAPRRACGARRSRSGVFASRCSDGQVVEQRRASPCACVFSSFVISPALAARRPRRSPRPPRRWRAAAWRRRGSGPRRRARRRRAKAASTSQYGSGMKARISSSRRARIASVGVCTRPSETAPSNERAQADRRGARGVHADDPVGLGARARGLLELAAAPRRGAGARTPRASPSSVIELQPEPLDGLLGPGLLVDVGEDQLALAAGVAGVDDAVDVVALQQPADDRHLLLRALVAHDELEASRHDRQVGHPPLLELRRRTRRARRAATRWPTAQVMMCSGPSSQRVVAPGSVCFWNGPGSTRARSGRPTASRR